MHAQYCMMSIFAIRTRSVLLFRWAHERFIRTLLNVLLAKDLCPASLDAEELRRAGGLVGGDALRTCFVSLEAQG